MSNDSKPPRQAITSLNPDLVDLDVRDMTIEELEKRLELSLAMSWLGSCNEDSCGANDADCDNNSCSSNLGNCDTNSCQANTEPCTGNGCSSNGLPPL